MVDVLLYAARQTDSYDDVDVQMAAKCISECLLLLATDHDDPALVKKVWSVQCSFRAWSRVKARHHWAREVPFRYWPVCAKFLFHSSARDPVPFPSESE